MTHFFWFHEMSSVKVDVVGLAFFLCCPERFVHVICSCTSSIPSVLPADPVADHPEVEAASIGFVAAVPFLSRERVRIISISMPWTGQPWRRLKKGITTIALVID